MPGVSAATSLRVSAPRMMQLQQRQRPWFVRSWRSVTTVGVMASWVVVYKQETPAVNRIYANRPFACRGSRSRAHASGFGAAFLPSTGLELGMKQLATTPQLIRMKPDRNAYQIASPRTAMSLG